MKTVELSSLLFQPASYDEREHLSYLTNKANDDKTDTDTVNALKFIGLSGIVLCAIVIIIACFLSTFFAEFAKALLPMFIIAWRVVFIYMCITASLAGIFYYIYTKIQFNFVVVHVLCIDKIIDMDGIIYIFSTVQNGEELKVIMKETDFYYAAKDITINMDCTIGFNRFKKTGYIAFVR